MKFLGLSAVAMSLLAATGAQAAPAAEGLAPRQYCPPGYDFPYWGEHYCNVPKYGANGCAIECGLRPECFNGLCCVNVKDGVTC